MRQDVIDSLKTGGVAVMATDTLYGVLASAFDKEAVEWTYFLKGRDPKKPVIVLLSDISDLDLFEISLSRAQYDALDRLWPGSVSVILDAPQTRFSYIHRGTKQIAFRVPGDEALRSFLKATGPLVAPSANPEGKTPADRIEKAREYFGERVDHYVDGGKITKTVPSTLISLEKDGSISVLREGAVKL